MRTRAAWSWRRSLLEIQAHWTFTLLQQRNSYQMNENGTVRRRGKKEKKWNCPRKGHKGIVLDKVSSPLVWSFQSVQATRGKFPEEILCGVTCHLLLFPGSTSDKKLSGWSIAPERTWTRGVFAEESGYVNCALGYTKVSMVETVMYNCQHTYVFRYIACKEL